MRFLIDEYAPDRNTIVRLLERDFVKPHLTTVDTPEAHRQALTPDPVGCVLAEN